MPGGIIDLAAKGAQDFYLTNNPQITFFKNVMKKHTNFSMELIEIDPSSDKNLQKSLETDIEFKIDRNGDLVKQIYFVFNLPDIYSSSSTYAGYKFKWIERIGEYIIKEVILEIGGQEIDKHYGEWLHIWNELTLSEKKKDGYNRMIANVSEVYDPKDSSDAYPPFSHTGAVNPVIRGRKVIVPLHFWFNYIPGSELPLIALQFSEVKIKFKLRPFNELFTVIDSSLRKKSPSDTYNLGMFLKASSVISELNISPKLEVNYIFLNDNERKNFSEQSHEYIINKIDRRSNISITPTGIANDDNNTIDLDFQHPVSNLIWKLRRSDFESSNQFSNYTNWYHKDINPLINDEHNEFAAEITIDEDNINSFKEKSILRSATLKFNGGVRLKEKTSGVFNLLNNYQHMKKIPEEGIYVYSFNLNHDIKSYQQSGSVNLSRIDNVQLDLTTIPKNESSSSYTYNVMIFVIQINILKIESGMASLQFAN